MELFSSISIHAPARGATTLCFFLLYCFRFQSTLPQGERHNRAQNFRFTGTFQSTLPQGERPDRAATSDMVLVFQSTLPQGERRDGKGHGFPCHISIHAPARGATTSTWRFPLTAWNFNPRSRKGSDVPPAQGLRYVRYFNPRSRKGSDARLLRHRLLILISIHAPARGATTSYSDTFIFLTISIHAPARGATFICRKRRRGYGYFNPRSRKGSDQRHWPIKIQSVNFNPRSRKGSDFGDWVPDEWIEISIHAPARGATEIPQKGNGYKKFQSTLPQGERQQKYIKILLFFAKAL